MFWRVFIFGLCLILLCWLIESAEWQAVEVEKAEEAIILEYERSRQELPENK